MDGPMRGGWRRARAPVVALLIVVSAVAAAGAAEPSAVRGAFLTVHLEVSEVPRIQRLWPRLKELVDLADRHGARLTVQFSIPWAEYVLSRGEQGTVAAWEAAGHEIAAHHHGPTHTFFDGYTNRPDLIRTDGWYATDGVYRGDMEDFMAVLDPLASDAIVTAGMSDAETDWPDGVLHYATSAGEEPAPSDLLSVPWAATYGGHRVTVVANAGYAIDHLGDAAVTLADVEWRLSTATADQIMGLVIDDNTLDAHFDEIEPLLNLLEEYGAVPRPVRELLASADSGGLTPPYPVPDAIYGRSGPVSWVQIPVTDCVNLTATPVVVGSWLVYPMHEHRRNCAGPGPYRRTLLGYDTREGKLYVLREDGAGEAPLVLEPRQRCLAWDVTMGGTVLLLDPAGFTVRRKVSLGATSDSSGVWLDGLYYLGTVNAPDSSCQNPTNPACGMLVALDSSGEVVWRLDIDSGFRAWVGTGLTTDGEFVYAGTAAQTVGEKTGDETEYLYGCSVVKLDRELRVLSAFDPGDLACYQQPYQGADMDSVAGEIPVGPQELWVQYVRPSDPGMRTALVVLEKENLAERCRVEFDYQPSTQTAAFYAAPTLDAEGNAYVPVTVPDDTGGRLARLLRITPQCEVTVLAEVAGAWAAASPTLADDRLVVFATDGRLDLLTFGGEPVRSYQLASPARVLASPVIHQGAIYVLEEDGTLNVIRGAGVTGYGHALWPRYRHDNLGSGDASATTAPTRPALRPDGRAGAP